MDDMKEPSTSSGRWLTRPLGVVLVICAIAHPTVLRTHGGDPGWVACGTEAQQKADSTRANPDALVLDDFNKRLETYVKLRDKLKDDAPPLKETKDPAKIRASQDALAAKIREARKDAKPGDIFPPEVRAKFRELMYPELKGAEGKTTKAVIKEDAPAGVKLKVNSTYPESQPLPTMPPNLLANLPKLPEDLEYRIIDKHLILRDVHANIIVDYIPNAIR
jgi:hypothetical protein